MSHITHFSVEGLAGRPRTFSQKLHRNLNVFFGRNGSGKTSLLKIFHSAMSNKVNILSRVAFKEVAVGIHSLTYDREFSYRIKMDKAERALHAHIISYNEELSAEEFEYLPELLQKGMPRVGWRITPALPKGCNGSWSHRFLPTSRLGGMSHQSHEMINEDTYDLSFVTELERVWHAFSSQVQSEVRQLQQNGIAEILGEVLTVKPERQSEDKVDWLSAYDIAVAFIKRQGITFKLPTKKEFAGSFYRDSIVRRVVHKIVDLEAKIDKRMASRTKLQQLLEKMFSGGKHLVLTDTKVSLKTNDGNPLELRSLSAGEKHLLRILFEAVSASESTLIIDEPEISLHIEWQRTLLSSIMEINPALQLIVATHSPEIMAEIDDAHIFEIPS